MAINNFYKRKNGFLSNLIKVRWFVLIIWSSLLVFQWLFWLQDQGFLTTLLTIIGGIAGITLFLKRRLLISYPISTLMILGYVSYYFFLPPIVTFFEGKPLSFNLLHPNMVLFHAFIIFIVLFFAHLLYSKWNFLQNIRWLFSDKLFKQLGFFRPPTNIHLLLMGIIGLLAMGYQIFFVGVYQNAINGILNKLLVGLYPLSYLPYAILVGKLFGQKKNISRKWQIVLFVYTIILTLISLGRNSRAALFTGLASIIIAFVFGLLINYYDFSKRIQKLMIIGFLFIILISKPLTDLSLSMVVVRGSRANISAFELVSNTITVFFDKDTLQKYRKFQIENKPTWDERYVDNIFFARMANLKFADNSLDLALSMSENSKQYYRQIEFQKILATFPRPIISFLKLPVFKDKVESASSGDFMFYIVTGYPYALGRFRTGSIFGSGYALFGWVYPIILFLLLLFIFPVLDSFSSKINNNQNLSNTKELFPIINPLIITGLFSWFFFLTSAATGSESLSDLVGFLLRDWLQIFLIYLVVFWITYIPLRIISRKLVKVG